MDAATVGLLSGGIGVGGTLLGTVFTQIRSDARDRVRLASEERREEQRMAVDARREREARLFDHRRAALLAVIEKYHGHAELAWQLEHHQADHQPGDEELEPFWQLLSEVDLYCGAEPAKIARALYSAVSAWLHGTGAGSFVTRQERAEQLFQAFLAAARAELGVPVTVADVGAVGAG
ncbi:hypothetical protein [Nocardioides halotolerans]|uniref:hypothetical protein n=1 Tax=Nocardioides halotolerans TaxID=433660 RepID=UPI00041C78F6|nr:hypothetical protein [Nocardioides halotolerans]